MHFTRFFAAAALMLTMLATPVFAQSGGILQCVTYARAVSDVDLRGNAYSWWAQAQGRYARGDIPRVGAVMAMPSFAGMRNGHVAKVSKVISDREILLDHANWSRPGMVERNVRAIDVSAKGDWSRVRIWHAASRDLGITSYPVSGFIYGRSTPMMIAQVQRTDRGPLLSSDILALAAREG